MWLLAKSNCSWEKSHAATSSHLLNKKVLLVARIDQLQTQIQQSSRDLDFGLHCVETMTTPAPTMCWCGTWVWPTYSRTTWDNTDQDAPVDSMSSSTFKKCGVQT